MHSLTKYCNGHSDVIMGAAITNDEEIHKKLKFLQMGMRTEKSHTPAERAGGGNHINLNFPRLIVGFGQSQKDV